MRAKDFDALMGSMNEALAHAKLFRGAWKVCGVPCAILESGPAAAMRDYLPPDLTTTDASFLKGLEYGLAIQPESGALFLAVKAEGARHASVSNFSPQGSRIQRELLALPAPTRGG